MSALLKLERSFQDCVLAGNHDMAGQVVGTASASAEERVGIYVDAYRLRLLEILEDNYPGLRVLVGDEVFDRLGRSYIDAHPSIHPSVRWFSRHLEEFLKTTAPYAGHPYLAEMAAFEWAQSMVFDAADAAQVAIEEMTVVAPDQWPG
ncbi:MAG TPA: DNA-binding domain-containing protein, partial [Gammaproteobacteria bacterium]|nr:DNA-binding domain-containing protein [Gammaproteobacteria bacterium]